MNISLPVELEKYIHDKVNSGLYSSASEVVRESLRLLTSYDNFLHKNHLKQLNQEIDKGLRQLKKHQGINADEVYDYLQEKIMSLAS